MKKIILINLAIFGIVFLAGCGQKQKDFQSPALEIPSSTTAATVQNQIYENKKYGFKLNIPVVWQGYNATERILDFGDLGKSNSIDFGLPDQTSGLFNISIHTKKQWADIKNENGAIPEYLGENGTYIFAWSQAQFTANITIENRMKEVSGIIKTFKITK